MTARQVSPVRCRPLRSGRAARVLRMRLAGWVFLTCRGWNWISCWCS